MARAWHLLNRPTGSPTDKDVGIRDIRLAELGEGMVHVKNRWLSVDPYMRGRMNDVKSYVPPFQIGEPMTGGAVGEVVASNDPSLKPGDLVFHMAGWRDEAVEPGPQFNKLPSIPGVEPQAFLGNLGLTGGTAYFGLLDVASAKHGDIIFVSAAAGAVGSAVVQIAKAKGMAVIGSAGGAEKCDYVRSLGADEVVDYKSSPILKALRAAAPKGIDVYFDNVGGDHLDAALACARQNARFATCGMIEVYNSSEPTCLRFLPNFMAQRIRMQGFIFTDYMHRMAEFYQDMGAMMAAGQVKNRDTVVEGLDNMLEAFNGLFSGANTGKMLVKL